MSILVWLICYLLPQLHYVRSETQLLGLCSSVKLLAQDIPESSLAINIVYDPRNKNQSQNAIAIATDLQMTYRLPTLLFGSKRAFWSNLRKRRMAWLGSINIVLLEATSRVKYLETLRQRFFTGTDLGIASHRKMDLIFENVFHMFPYENHSSWLMDKPSIEEKLEEAINLIVLSSSKNESVFNSTKVYWNKGNALGTNTMDLVNEWITQIEFTNPDHLVPPIEHVYSNLNGRHFLHPIMHKPPWNYVTLDRNGKFVEDNGGRDVTLTEYLAQQLGFSFEPLDPLEAGINRTRGSSWTEGYDFEGILGKLHRREDPFHFYLGDTTQTFTRNSAVDFSFMILADSGAFASQAPSSYIPPDLLLRPFEWPVWMFTLVMILIVWICLIFFLLHGKNMYHKFQHDNYDRSTTLFTESIFDSITKSGFMLLRMVFYEPDYYFIEHTHPYLRPFRFLTVTTMAMIVCVVLPSYNGALFSFFSVPFYEKPLDFLPALHDKMTRNHSLGVVAGSSSLGILRTGGGIYLKIWDEMERQNNWLIPDVQTGLEMVLSDPSFSVFAGREKLIFDALRLGGAQKIHVNKEIFFTKYKCVALRNGSPLKKPFNRVLLSLFESGILSKVTEDEYLGIKRRIGKNGKLWEDMYKINLSSRDGYSFKPMKLAPLHSLFSAGGIGLLSALMAFVVEMYAKRCGNRNLRPTKNDKSTSTKNPLPISIMNEYLI